MQDAQNGHPARPQGVRRLRRTRRSACRNFMKREGSRKPLGPSARPRILKTVIQRGRRRSKTGGLPVSYVKDFDETRTLLEAMSNEGSGCSKWPSSKAAGSAATEAYPGGTSQGAVRPRTKLEPAFSIPLQKDVQNGCPARPQAKQNRRRTLRGTLRILMSQERCWRPFSTSFSLG